MIDKLIEKYKEQKFSSDFAKSSIEALMVNQKIDEILQDLEEIKKHQLEILNQTRRYLNSQKVTPEMVAIAMRKIEISILGVIIDE